MRTDPFRDLDRFAETFFRPSGLSLPMDAFQHGDVVTLYVDMPGVEPDSIDLTVERNELKIEARRAVTSQADAQHLVRERPTGTYTRRLWVGDNLDTDHIDAEYVNGVLAVRIPLRESAKPRKVEIRAGEARKAVTA